LTGFASFAKVPLPDGNRQEGHTMNDATETSRTILWLTVYAGLSVSLFVFAVASR
jgi:hypothetical protein